MGWTVQRGAQCQVGVPPTIPSPVLIEIFNWDWEAGLSSQTVTVVWASEVCFCFCSVKLMLVCEEWRTQWWEEGVWAAVYRAERLLSRGSASRVCCWPDQLAVCLAGVWHITTKGFGQTGDCTVLIYPPIWAHLHLFPPLSILSCGMHRANVEVWFFRKVKCNTAYRIPTILYSLQCWRYTYWTDSENFFACTLG